MSFFERRATQWTWSESEQKLELKDRAKKMAWIQTVIFGPSLYFMAIIIIDEWNWLNFILTSLVLIPFLILFLIAFKTTSLKSCIDLVEIDLAVVKKGSKGTISLKLTNGRYRQLYFVAGFQYVEFIRFLNSHHIPIEERAPIWSIPLNY